MKRLALGFLLGLVFVLSNVCATPCFTHSYDLDGKHFNDCPHCLAEEQANEIEELKRKSKSKY